MTKKIRSLIKVSDGPNNFPAIIFRIILTWQPVFMISQVWARLEYHLRIFNWGGFVIFFDITNSKRKLFKYDVEGALRQIKRVCYKLNPIKSKKNE